MRPKKHILLIDPDDAHCSTMSYTLGIKGFRVTTMSDLPSQNEFYKMRNAQYDLVVCFWDRLTKQFSTVIHALMRYNTVLTFVGTPSATAEVEAYQCSTVTKTNHRPMAELLEDIHVLSARKRGPRKKPVANVEIDIPSTRVQLG